MDEIEILQRLGEVSEPDAAVFARAREIFEDRAIGLTPSPVPSRLRGWRTRGLVGATVTAIAAAVALSLAVALPGGPGRPRRQPPDPVAVAVLLSAARGSATTVATLPGPGKYVYTRTVDMFLDHGNGFGGRSATYWYSETQTTQTWTAADGSGRTMISYTPAKFISPASQQAWKRSGQPLPTSHPVDQLYGPSAQRAHDYLDPSGLPTTPRALRTALAQHYRGASNPFGLLETAASLLQEPGLDPAVRSSLYQMLAETPGLHSYGPSTVTTGGVGQAIGLVVSGLRIELVINPTSGALLGQKKIVANPTQLPVSPGETPEQISGSRTQPAGTVMDSRAFLESTIVTSTTAS